MKPYRATSLAGAQRRVRQLQKQLAERDALLSDISNQRLLMARLAANSDAPAALPSAYGSAFYCVKVEVCGGDRLSCSAHLRKIADMIMSGDAPGWTTSDINGSAMAERSPALAPALG